MRHPTVYLAGPIVDCDAGEANDWRSMMIRELAKYGIAGISPLRCEPAVNGRYALTYQDPRFGTARAIASKNILDVRTADLTCAYLPKKINDRRPSYGTVSELAWAHIIGKPPICVSDDPFVLGHPVIDAYSGWKLETLEDAIEVIVGVLEAYGKRVA